MGVLRNTAKGRKLELTCEQIHLYFSPCFIPQSVFYTQSIVRSLCFILIGLLYGYNFRETFLNIFILVFNINHGGNGNKNVAKQKGLMNITVTCHVCFKLCTFPSCLLQNNKSKIIISSPVSGNGNHEGNFCTFILEAKHCLHNFLRQIKVHIKFCDFLG